MRITVAIRYFFGDPVLCGVYTSRGAAERANKNNMAPSNNRSQLYFFELEPEGDEFRKVMGEDIWLEPA